MRVFHIVNVDDCLVMKGAGNTIDGDEGSVECK